MADEDPNANDESQSFLPPFANAENKALDAAVRKYEKHLEVTERELEENQDRIKFMDDHLKNVQTETKYTQSRVDAENKEIETETHLKALAAREVSRLRNDAQRFAKERLELAEKITSLQNQILKVNETTEQFKVLMNWNQEELDQWALAERQKEEDNSALEKYKHQDESKVKELTLQLEKLTKQVVNKKAELDSEVMDTQATQIQLDKAAEDFRKLHEERQSLLRQWDDASAAMSHRDAAIGVASEQFAAQKANLREKQYSLDAQAKFLGGEQANNKELDARISLYDREVGKLRDVYMREQARADEAQNQVELIKATLARMANELGAKIVESKSAKNELGNKRSRLDVARKRFANLKHQLETEYTQLDTLESKVDELERIRKSEELHLKQLTKEAEDLKKEQFKRAQSLFELRQKERELISEISGGQGQNKNLASRIRQYDEQVVRQQELLYNVEFQLQQMERKVARAQGVRNDEETRALNERILKLTSILETVNNEHSMLMEQVKHTEEDLYQARRQNQALRGDKTKMDEQISTVKLETDMTGRQVKLALDEKEKAMVEHDVLKLEMRRLQDLLALHADEVFSLENRKFQLKASMEERRQEIEINRDALRTELKLLRDDIHRITLELTERALKVEKLQAKFQVLSSKNQSTDPDDQEPKSQAYYVIKAAQEREELQRQGDVLDARIVKAEKEVAALEATLRQLKVANEGLGTSYKKVDGKSVDVEKKRLRDKLDKTFDKLKLKRSEESELIEDARVAEGRLATLSQEYNSLRARVNDMAMRKVDAERQLDDQDDKYGRAKRAVERIQRQVRSKFGLPLDASGGVAAQELDIRLCDTRELTRAMLQELKVLAMQNPTSGIAERVEAMGLKFPTTSGPASTASSARSEGRAPSQTGSARSSTSSVTGRNSPRYSQGGSPAGVRPASRPSSSLGGAPPRSPALRSAQLGI